MIKEVPKEKVGIPDYSINFVISRPQISHPHIVWNIIFLFFWLHKTPYPSHTKPNKIPKNLCFYLSSWETIFSLIRTTMAGWKVHRKEQGKFLILRVLSSSLTNFHSLHQHFLYLRYINYAFCIFLSQCSIDTSSAQS